MWKNTEDGTTTVSILSENGKGHPSISTKSLDICTLMLKKPYLLDRRKLKGIMDSRLEGKFPSKAAFCITQLSMKCLASEPKHRPSMKDVLENLERIQAANEKPVEPKFRSTHAANRQGH
ncbi:hypothetical protein JHK84_038807 [Glycine max]|nr:hypothetical protein JHK84_038807 [Glycine max]